MSMAYRCPVCNQRFEHEEVDEKGLKQYCSNCVQEVYLECEGDDDDDDYEDEDGY